MGLQPRNKLTLKYPASWWKNMWREALPSGNGIIGAAVYGAVKHESILISHEHLWHWGKKDFLPDVSYTLQETRQLMDKQRFQEANWHLANSLTEKHGYSSRLASRFPVAALKLNMNGEQAFKQYSRSVNMENGEVEVCWKDGETTYTRTLFVSRADNAIVYEITSDKNELHGDITLAFHPTDEPDLVEACKAIEESVQQSIENEFVYYAARNDDGNDFGAVMRLVMDDGALIEHSDTKLGFHGSTRLLVLVKVFVNGEREKEWKRLKHELSHMKVAYAELLRSHAALHAPLFDSVQVELEDDQAQARSNEELLLDAYDGEASTELVSKMWSYGRYLFVSGTHAHGQPFGLYGLWGGDYDLIWSHNMANENVQMMYWHAPVGGLTELMPALFQYYDSMMDDFRENAAKLFGCRGIYIPAGTTPGIGVPNQIVPVILNRTGAAAWLARHYYEYYQFTGDKAMLIDKILPFMKETLQFYEDFLVRSEDGSFKLYPSVSPENSPANFESTDDKPLEHPMPTTINATMEIALLKELLVNMLDGCKETGLYQDSIVKWKNMLTCIPSYQVNQEGTIREWMDDQFEDHYNHRHLSHIYAIFPGQEFTREEQPELFKHFEIAVRKRLIGAQSGWSLVHMAAIYARLGDGNQALECLDILARSCLLNNFMTLHNDWRNMGVCLNMPEAPIQLDANMGWVNAVQEMLLYASTKMVKLLPALPERWNSGKVTNMRFCGGAISFSWNKATASFEAVLDADRESSFVLKLPVGFKTCVLSGHNVSFSPHAYGEHYYEVKLKEQGRLVISNG